MYLVDSRGISSATTAGPRWFTDLALAEDNMMERVHHAGDKATVCVANSDGTFRCVMSMTALGSWSTVYRHRRRDNAIDKVGRADAFPTRTDRPGLHWMSNEIFARHYQPERQLVPVAA